ncbi:MAG: 4Fe-4S dicluster domain-containing protein [Lachnospiraceae bacterium]
MKLLEQIKEAGIVGCGGAGFPAHIKLNCKVEYLIVNAAECEPLLRTDRWLMIHKAPEIIAAIDMVAGLVQANHVCIALKETYHQEIAALEAAISSQGSKTSIYRMKNFYPAGDEQIMVCDITRRTVPPSGIPLDVGAVVSNTATIFAIYEASQGEPLIYKYLTVTGAVHSPCIVHAPVGTSFQDCLAAAGGSTESKYHIISGGPMMGKCSTMNEAEVISVTKTTSGFIVLPDQTPLVQTHSIPVSVSIKRAKMCCIQCSYCTQMCPRYLTGHPLQPHLIMRKLSYALKPEDILTDEAVCQAMTCSECGVCETYACPMGLNPRQVNIYLKQLLRQREYRYPKPSGSLTPRVEREYRRVSSRRLAARLGVDRYYDLNITSCITLNPTQVTIPLKQHIGAPAIPTVECGAGVTQGQLIGRIEEGMMGAHVHASIRGTIIHISDTDITIRAEEQGGDCQ